VPQKELVFGKVFSDHMLEIDWDDEKVRAHRETWQKEGGEGGRQGGRSDGKRMPGGHESLVESDRAITS